MKVIVVDEGLCWPLDNGKKIRTYNLLTRMAREHEILVVAYGNPLQDAEAMALLAENGIHTRLVPLPAIPKQGWRAVLAAIYSALQGLPYSAAMYNQPTMAQALRSAITQFEPDLLHAELTVLGPTVSEAMDVPSVLGSHNHEAQIWWRLAERTGHPMRKAAYRIQSLLMKEFERKTLQGFAHVLAVSDSDIASLRDLSDHPAYWCVPNGVDVGHYTVSENAGAPHSLVFTGALDWRPTIDAVRFLLTQIHPRLRREFDDAVVIIAGRNPPDHLADLIRKTPGATLLANVEDIRVPISEASVAVSPIRSGSGTRLKILEAMALGRPVVSTCVGAEGLDVQNERELLLADDPGAFVKSVARLWREPELYSRLALEGRTFVEAHYDWESIAPRLDAAWKAASNESGGSPARRPDHRTRQPSPEARD